VVSKSSEREGSRKLAELFLPRLKLLPRRHRQLKEIPKEWYSLWTGGTFVHVGALAIEHSYQEDEGAER
jgi:hypothetical protein